MPYVSFTKDVDVDVDISLDDMLDECDVEDFEYIIKYMIKNNSLPKILMPTLIETKYAEEDEILKDFTEKFSKFRRGEIKKIEIMVEEMRSI